MQANYTRTTPNARPNLDHKLIADRALCRREELRDLPEAMSRACRLARGMIDEQCLFDEEDGRSPYNHLSSLDALLAMIQGTASYLAGQLEVVIGETDSDLPTVDGQEVAE